MGEILKCDHSNESYWAVLSSVLFIMPYIEGGSPVTVETVDEISWTESDYSKSVRTGFNFWVHKQIPKSYNSNESHSAALFQGNVYYAVQWWWFEFLKEIRKVWSFNWKLFQHFRRCLTKPTFELVLRKRFLIQKEKKIIKIKHKYHRLTF